MSAPSCSAAFQKGRNSGSSSVRPLTWSLISAPLRPSRITQRSSSAIAAFTSCIGSVPSPANRVGHARVIEVISSLVSCAVAAASLASS
jgi:hypothetical protein